MAWPEFGYFSSIAIAGVAAAALPGARGRASAEPTGEVVSVSLSVFLSPRPAALVLKSRSMTRNTENGKKEVSLLFWGPPARGSFGGAARRRRAAQSAAIQPRLPYGDREVAGESCGADAGRSCTADVGGRPSAEDVLRENRLRQPRTAATRFSENAGPAAPGGSALRDAPANRLNSRDVQIRHDRSVGRWRPNDETQLHRLLWGSLWRPERNGPCGTSRACPGLRSCARPPRS